MSSWQHTVAMYVSPFGRFDNLESCWATIRSSRCLTGSPFNQHFGWMWHRTNRWQLIWKWFPPSPSLSTAVGNTIILLSQFRREFGRGTRLKDYLTPHKSTWTLTFPFTFKHFSRRDSFPSLLVLQNNDIFVCWDLCTNKWRGVPLSNWNTTQRRQFGIISFEVERPSYPHETSIVMCNKSIVLNNLTLFRQFYKLIKWVREVFKLIITYII